MSLRLDWCSHEAAKYAVEKWYHSPAMPKSKLAKIGVWESGKFIGVVIFGSGANSNLVKPYGLKTQQGCELVRLALSNHETPLSRIITIAIKILKKAMPDLRLIVTFADPEQGHAGGVYQAAGWLYAGMTTASEEYIVNGIQMHGRAFRNGKPKHLTTKQALAMIDPNYKKVLGSSKHRYLYPLDSVMREQIEPLRKPYPKRAVSIGSNAPAFQTGQGGASPTTALQKVQL